MRIVSGEFKGKHILAPTGRTTRPTSDRLRETIFNILSHAPWAQGIHGRRVVDCFAGSGALGFEALSRGAEFCLFVESASKARGYIRSNIEALQLFGRTRIHRRSATDLGVRPASLGAPFDLVFLDPPYGLGLEQRALKSLEEGNWLANSAIAVVETSADADEITLETWSLLDVRTSGPSRLTFLERRPSAN